METCTTHDLLITNTVFRLPTHNKTSWMHPHPKHWHLLDYLIVRQRDRQQDVRVTKTMYGAECWTDHRLDCVIVRQRDRQDVRVIKTLCGAACWTHHRLLISKMNLSITPPRRPQSTKVLKRLNVSKLKSYLVKQELAEELESKLQSTNTDPDTDVETKWVPLPEDARTGLMTITAKINSVLEENHLLHRELLNDSSSSSKKEAFNVAKE